MNLGEEKGRAGIMKHGKGERMVTSTWVLACSNVTCGCSYTLMGDRSTTVSLSEEATLNGDVKVTEKGVEGKEREIREERNNNTCMDDVPA